MQAITTKQLLGHPVVLQALNSAWNDSQADDPDHRHEEGGWVYTNSVSGVIFIRRAPAGQRSMIDLTQPPELEEAFVVARFHTHPNPSSEGWYTGPSTADTEGAWEVGVPCLIRADDGIHTTGPDSRIGGLTGNAGYPQ